MSGAREVSREEAVELHRMVEELSTKAGLPKPRVFLIDAPHANAFATGRSPEKAAVAVTRGLLEVLSRREVRGVLAHEIAHVANRDVLVATVAAGLATAVTHLAHVFAFSGPDGAATRRKGTAPAACSSRLRPPSARLSSSSASPARGSTWPTRPAPSCPSGVISLALASALEKLHREADVAPAQAEPATASLYIVNPFGSLGGLTGLFSTHPPAGERVRRLRAMAVETQANHPIRGAVPRRPQHG